MLMQLILNQHFQFIEKVQRQCYRAVLFIIVYGSYDYRNQLQFFAGDVLSRLQAFLLASPVRIEILFNETITTYVTIYIIIITYFMITT